jgi:hypothetical protein
VSLIVPEHTEKSRHEAHLDKLQVLMVGPNVIARRESSAVRRCFIMFNLRFRRQFFLKVAWFTAG